MAVTYNYKGIWNAVLNVPMLSDGVGTTNDIWLIMNTVSTGNTFVRNLGSGPTTWVQNQYAVYTGTHWVCSLGYNVITTSGGTISLTTSGSTGPSTLVGSVLNVPNYSLGLGNYLPTSGGTLTGELYGTGASFSGIVSANLFAPTITGVTGGSTTNLTSSSGQIWVAQSGAPTTTTIVLPNATTILVGATYIFNNNATGNLVIQQYGGGILITIPSGGYATIILQSASFFAGQWDSFISGTSSSTWGTAGLTVNGYLAQNSVLSSLIKANGSGQLVAATPGTDYISSISGTTLQIDVTTSGTTKVISIDSGYVGQTSINTVGTINTGTWATGAYFGPKIGLALGGDANGDIYYNSGGLFTNLAIGTSGQTLISNGVTPQWATLNVGVTNIATNNGITGGPITSTGTIGLAPISANSVLANTSGSTASPYQALGYSYTPAANTLTTWDTNKNHFANNFISGIQQIAVTSGTTLLTSASPYFTVFSGSTNQIVQLPNTSTLTVGQSFLVMSNCTSGTTIYLQSYTGVALQSLVYNTQVVATCLSTSGNTSSAWDIAYMNTSNAIGGFGASLLGSGGVINTGYAVAITVPYAMTITGWNIVSIGSLGLLSGSIVVDVRNSSGTSLVGSGNAPTLSSASSANASVSGWTTTAIPSGTIILFYVTSAITVQNVTVEITGTKS